MVRKTKTYKLKKLRGGQKCTPGTSGCLPGGNSLSRLGASLGRFFSRRKSPSREAKNKMQEAEEHKSATRRAESAKKMEKMARIAALNIAERWEKTRNALKRNVQEAKYEMEQKANNAREVRRLEKEIAELEKGVLAADKEYRAIHNARSALRSAKRITAEREGQRSLAPAYGKANSSYPPPVPSAKESVAARKAALKAEAKLPEAKRLVAARTALDNLLDVSASRTRFLNTPAKAAQRKKITDNGQKIIDEYLEALKAAPSLTATEEKNSGSSNKVETAKERLKSA